MKYLVWSYDYSHASAGPKVLHRLAHELNLIGERAEIGNGYALNPDWDTRHGSMDDDTIAIYPEIVPGNPWNAQHVVRWVLNVPGRLGGDRTYPASEMVFTYARLFGDWPLLHLPAAELDIYTDRGEARSGALTWTGKARRWKQVEGREITLAERLDRHSLADALNHAEVLYSFDMMSGMIDLARLCGCPVVVIPDGTHTYEEWDREIGWEGIGWDILPASFDPALYRARYLLLIDEFHRQLARFVDATAGVVA